MGQAARYRVAGRVLGCDSPLPALAPFHTNDEEPGLMSQAPFDLDLGEHLGTRRATGWVAEEWRTVTCAAYAAGYRIEVDGVGRFAVSADGSQIVCEETGGRERY